MQHIRNFSIIAHIDHGKSTLSDRLIELCGGLSEREMSAQVLDAMDLEKERGITIKAHSVTLNYTSQDGRAFLLNFIDTPGHVDFSYEVSRSLSACEGALLVVDAAQSVEAQTLAVCYTAIDQGLEILTVLNKIDLPQADPAKVIQDIEEIIGISAANAILVSAKTGKGVPELLERIISDIPAPKGTQDALLQALIIDSWFDSFLGVVSLVCVKNGCLKVGEKMRVMSTGRDFEVTGIGIFTPRRKPTNALSAGEVGYVVAGIKEINGAPVGDTLTHTAKPAKEPLPGFQKIKPQVYAGLFPTQADDFPAFREALQKLALNDAALFFEPESSEALGFGFRCGFLGMLHKEIVQERLEREYGLDLITTAPTVVYEILTTQGEIQFIDNPARLPVANVIAEIREPIAKVNILLPQQYLGSVMTLCMERRGTQKSLKYLGHQVSLVYEMPMAEIVMDFFDRLKSVSRGYASLDYSFTHFLQANLVKLDLMINGEKVDALAVIIHRENAVRRGRQLVEKMQKLIPRHMFDVAIQAAIGANVIARTTVKAMRKNVLAKCYGGDVSRKRKLLEKQKEGKKRMKRVGSVDVPQEAFLAILKVDKE